MFLFHLISSLIYWTSSSSSSSSKVRRRSPFISSSDTLWHGSAHFDSWRRLRLGVVDRLGDEDARRDDVERWREKVEDSLRVTQKHSERSIDRSMRERRGETKPECNIGTSQWWTMDRRKYCSELWRTERGAWRRFLRLCRCSSGRRCCFTQVFPKIGEEIGNELDPIVKNIDQWSSSMTKQNGQSSCVDKWMTFQGQTDRRHRSINHSSAEAASEAPTSIRLTDRSSRARERSTLSRRVFAELFEEMTAIDRMSRCRTARWCRRIYWSINVIPPWTNLCSAEDTFLFFDLRDLIWFDLIWSDRQVDRWHCLRALRSSCQFDGRNLLFDLQQHFHTDKEKRFRSELMEISIEHFDQIDQHLRHMFRLNLLLIGIEIENVPWASARRASRSVWVFECSTMQLVPRCDERISIVLPPPSSRRISSNGSQWKTLRHCPTDEWDPLDESRSIANEHVIVPWEIKFTDQFESLVFPWSMWCDVTLHDATSKKSRGRQLEVERAASWSNIWSQTDSAALVLYVSSFSLSLSADLHASSSSSNFGNIRNWLALSFK